MILGFIGLLLYAFTAFGNIYSIHHRDQSDFHRNNALRCKYLLMPLLLFSYLGFTHFHPALPVVLALAFAFGGDFLLEQGPKWFVPGLVSFLLGHIGWIVSLIGNVNLLNLSWWFVLPLLPLLFYGILILRILLHSPSTKSIRIPLAFYMLTLILLGEAAFISVTRGFEFAFLCNLLGALLFITSDTLLAFFLFLQKKEWGIMLTYCLAELLLMVGSIL